MLNKRKGMSSTYLQIYNRLSECTEKEFMTLYCAVLENKHKRIKSTNASNINYYVLKYYTTNIWNDVNLNDVIFVANNDYEFMHKAINYVYRKCEKYIIDRDHIMDKYHPKKVKFEDICPMNLNNVITTIVEETVAEFEHELLFWFERLKLEFV
jgi:hypothetical protein